MNFYNLLNKPAFVIHVNELSPERSDFFTNNIKNAGYTDMRIFKGVNARNKDELNMTFKNFNNPKIHKDLSKGQIGCLFSHLKLYQYIISNNIDICTIFEDDVHFHPDWNIIAPKFYEYTPKNFDIIFIGNQIDECIEKNNTISKINTKACFCTHAYVITLNGAKKMLTYLLNWDYDKALKDGNNEALTGLFAIDIMIKNIQERMTSGNLKKKIIWYCWNGTKNTCKYNELPLSNNMNYRNTGLVFQSSEFISIVDPKLLGN
jgi:GR25 family glycosyltransferase involved in LPS biosynthesis